MGYPVVVKPLDGNHGKGVSIDLTTPEQVKVAFEEAYEFSSVVIVETFQVGNDYRILVVDGRVVAAAQRVPGHVVGDGTHTIAGRGESGTPDPPRGDAHA